jgi:TetR/AcrR family transcriptional regulator, transcriptional repressor of aconitase
MPKLTQVELDARRSDILNAAARCFSRKGIHATTMREIFAEVGMSAGAVYNYFPTKDALITAGLVASTQESADAILSATEGEDGVRDFSGIMALFLADLKAARHDGRAKATPMVHAEVSVRPELLTLFKHGREKIRDAARHQLAQMRPDLTDQQRSTLVNFVFAFYQGLVTEAALEEDTDINSMQEIIDLVLTHYAQS